MPVRLRAGQDGLLFPAGDAAALRRLLLDLLAQPERLRQLQASIGPAWTIEAHVRHIEEIYSSVQQADSVPEARLLVPEAF